MSYSKTIFKQDSKGKIRFLCVQAHGNIVSQETGIVGSENTVTQKSPGSKGKNIGRSNETTPAEQARFEAEAKIKSKMSTGYFNTEEEARNTVVVLPMLAKDYKKEIKKVDWTKPVYAQPKLDGMRAMAAVNKQMLSRKGKPIVTVSHITLEIDSEVVIADYLDGELYAHGLNFQENMRLIKKNRPGETENIKYHVYDMILPNVSFANRYLMLKQAVAGLENIELVPTYPIHSEEDLKRIHKKFLAQGYEGTIVRHSDAGYGVNKRDSQLLKYKDFIDIAIPIKDVVPMDQKPDQGQFLFHWPGADHAVYGKDVLGCGMKFSHKEREEILLNKADYIGKTAEVRFFEYSEAGVPRFPVAHGVRLDK